MNLGDIATRLLKNHTTKWVKPQLKWLDPEETIKTVEEISTENFNTENGLSTICFEDIVEDLKKPKFEDGISLYVIGAAGQGKSRLAVETAAALLQSGMPCILITHQHVKRISGLTISGGLKEFVTDYARAFHLSNGNVDKLLEK